MTQGNNSGGAGVWAGGIPGVPAVAGRFQPYLLEPGSPNAYTCFGSWETGARSCVPIEEADDPLDGCSQSGECRRFTLEQNPPTTRFPVSPRRDGRFEIQQFRDFIREQDTYNMAIEIGRIVVTYPGNRSVPKANRFFLNVKNLEEAELDVDQEFELIVTVERMILRQAGALSPTGAPRGGRPVEEDPEARRLRIAARLRKAAGEAARSSDGLGDELELELDIDFDDDVEIDDELDDEEEIEIDLSGDDTVEAVDDDPDGAADVGVDDIAGLDDFDDADLDGLEGLEGDDEDGGEGEDEEAPPAPASGEEAPPVGKTKKKGEGKSAKGAKGEGKSAKAEGKSAPAKKAKAAPEAEPAPKKKADAAPKASATEESAPAKKKGAEKEAPAKAATSKKEVAPEAPKKKAAAPAAKKAEPEAPAPKAKAADSKKAAAAPAKADKKKR